jgi:hypothetical protein
VGPDKHIVLCSVYTRPMLVWLLADAVVRVATRFHLPVIDWHRVVTQLEDFANPSEPSSVGGQKMAEMVVMVVKQHSFSSQVSVVYPQQWPESLPHQDLAPQGQVRDTPVTSPLPSPSSLLPEAAVGTPTGTQEQHPSFASSVSAAATKTTPPSRCGQRDCECCREVQAVASSELCGGEKHMKALTTSSL